MTSSKAWKDHERYVAAYFNTKRRVRGADFGVSDIEVLANVKDWIGWECNVTLAVECKYSKKFTIHDHYIKQEGKKRPLILKVGSYLIVNLAFFTEFFSRVVLRNEGILELGMDFIESDKKPPQYLDDYRIQADMYAEKEGDHCIPVSCLGKASCQTKLICIHVDDLEHIIDHYNDNKGSCKCKVP